jgi:hypothetical protein
MSNTPVKSTRMERNNLSSGPRSLPFLVKLFLLLAVACAGVRAEAQTPGFTITNTGPLKLASGTFGPTSLTITPTNGYTGFVNVFCLNMPAYAYCKFPDLNQSFSLANGPITVTFDVNTNQVDNYQARLAPFSGRTGQIALASMLLPGFGLLVFGRRRRSLQRIAIGMIGFCGVLSISACGSTLPKTTPPGNYTIQLVGNPGAQNVVSPMTLIVT